MDIIADTNIFLAVTLNEPEKERVIQLTESASIMAPDILPYEIGNALSAMVKRHRLTADEALNAEKFSQNIPVRLVSVDIQDSLQLAVENNIYAYDAYFLQCARAYSHPLLTLDRRVRQVAIQLGIKIVE